MTLNHVKVGIYSIGSCLPDQVRKNDYWDRELVEQWNNRHVWDKEKEEKEIEAAPTEGVRRVLKAISEHSEDPFCGAVERRVLPTGMSAADMETAAANEALEKAGIDRDEIDLLLGFTFIPDYFAASNACILHQRLGLRSDCFTLAADAVCNSFQMQLAIAQNMIAAGGAKYGLLVQSSAVWRVTGPDHPISIHFGDGATAVVVGKVAPDKGIIAQEHRTDGSFHRALVCSVKGKNWWEDGPIQTMSLDKDAARQMLLGLADNAQDVVGKTMSKAGVTPLDVDFFACHQPTVWFRRVVQEHIGLENAKTVDTYPFAGSLSAANLPLVLSIGEGRGLLKEGDLVAMYQGGTGMTYSGTVLRWGK